MPAPAQANTSVVSSVVPSPPKTSRHFYCPSCNGDVAFQPGADALVCSYCGWTEVIAKTLESVQERSYEAYLQEATLAMSLLAEHSVEVDCKTCGATVIFESSYRAGACAFCAAPLVVAPRMASPVIAPESVVPFRLKTGEANQRYQQWLRKRWFAPNDLKKLAEREPIKGVYLPHWTFDSHTFSHYTGERGDAYDETETYTERDSNGNSQTRTRQVRKIQWTYVSGAVTVDFDDVLVPAINSIEPVRLQALEPWELQESLVDYTPSYLAGFLAQQAQVDLKQGFEHAKERMREPIHNTIRADIGGDEQRIFDVKTQHSGVTFKHILLPTYVSAYQYRKKTYQFLVNGRTGEVYGKRPYSFWKIFLFSLAMAVVVAGLVLLAYFWSHR